MSSATKQLHFTTNIYIAGHHPILQVAKELGTVERKSRTRCRCWVDSRGYIDQFAEEIVLKLQ